MANPATRETLKQYALRALGKPVIEINVDDDQLEDRLDEALQYFAQYHYDGIQRAYLKYQYTHTFVLFYLIQNLEFFFDVNQKKSLEIY